MEDSPLDAVIGLTLLQHPDPARVGQTASLFGAQSGGEAAVSRLEPNFLPSTGGVGSPLSSPSLSRSPLRIRAEQASTNPRTRVLLDPTGTSSRVKLNGRLLTGPTVLEPEMVEEGVALDIAGVVVLLLHELPTGEPPSDDLGIFGESSAIRRVRADIRRVADLELCVLIRGESGSGKELVARAVHDQSQRQARPFVAVNMAAIPPSVGGSMLFGHTRGAFTGASEASPGFFGNAQSGTLFLDEIGETPSELQASLLRAIREREIQPVGAPKPKTVDVRLVSATDANLESLVDQGGFSMPLLRRIEGFTIQIPALRERKDDIARLFFRFLAEELAALGEENKLAEPPPTQKPWLPTSLLVALLDYPFPGNVAELKTIAQRVAISNRDRDRFVLDPTLEQRLHPPAAPVEPLRPSVEPFLPSGPTPRADTADLSDEDIVSAMRACHFKVKSAAHLLGVSRSWLNDRIESCDGLRKAKTLQEPEIREALSLHSGKIAEMARTLEVSEHGLKLRIRALDIH